MKYIEKAAMWISCAIVTCFGTYITKETGCVTIMLAPVAAIMADGFIKLWE